MHLSIMVGAGELRGNEVAGNPIGLKVLLGPIYYEYGKILILQIPFAWIRVR
jgi:hypothetical protein